MTIETLMDDGPGSASGHLDLGSRTVKQRLNQVDKIRANGVGDHIALPQLVVCGAQSAGKSSVLEGVTGIPFPRQDGVCTKFATEIILRHQPGDISITASIIPHSKQDDAKAKKLRDYRRHLKGYDELPEVISHASRLMGIRGFGPADDSDAPAFAADVLRIEVVGDVGLHLTVVDLPGLVAVDENHGGDINLVSDLVDSYLQNSRTIILAVVQAGNDIVTEPIIQRARSFDSAGERTVGIITKPDLINKGTEARVAKIINNEDETKLKLGFFLLKNPSPEELAKGLSASERNKAELGFFESTAWKDAGLKKSRLGIEALRSFLQKILEEHIEKELPKVRKEIQALLERTQNYLHDLGTERATVGDKRHFLTSMSMDFTGITQPAVDGIYNNVKSDFFAYEENELSVNRLRCQIQHLNTLFGDYMREKSYKRMINCGNEKRRDFGHLSEVGDPLYVHQSEFNDWVKKVSTIQSLSAPFCC